MRKLYRGPWTEDALCYFHGKGIDAVFSVWFKLIKPTPQGSKKIKSNAPAAASEDIPHILGIISSLFSNTPSDSPDRIRLLAKFVENNYEKADKLLEVRENARNRLKVVDAEIAAEKKVCAM